MQNTVLAAQVRIVHSNLITFLVQSSGPGPERVQTSRNKLAFHHQVSTEMTGHESSGTNLCTYRSFIFPNIYFISDQQGSEGLASLHWRKNRINTLNIYFVNK